MRMRGWWLLLCAVLCVSVAHADDLRATLFAETPVPASGEFAQPRALAIDAETGRCYILDTGLQRIVAVTPAGEQVAGWSLDDLGIDLSAMPADPMLPIPALAIGGKTAYLLQLDRVSHRLTMTAFDGPGSSKTVTLPDQATYGAVTVDSTGKALVAYLRITGGKAELVLAREGDTGKLANLTTLADPCDGQMWNLSITGIATTPDGRVAIGMAQNGDAGYAFTRSWLVQGTVRTGTATLRTTHRFSLLDGRGRVQERFRAVVERAGSGGYPAKPCVPLFTALALAGDGTVVSGGHTADPFLRVYSADGSLLNSVPRQAMGGQHIAVLPGKEQSRLFALSTPAWHIAELGFDGRPLGGFGRPVAFNLSRPLALAADKDSLYAAARWNDDVSVLRFAANGRLLWARRIAPPRDMEGADPVLAAPGNGRVLIGWRQAGANGIGWVDTLQDDGTPGLPLWAEPYTGASMLGSGVCPSPMLLGDNGRLYILRELREGARLQAFSPSGSFLQQFPPEVQGITAVQMDNSLIWVRQDGQGLVIASYTPQGVERSWRRLPRSAEGAVFLPAAGEALYGWLSSTQSVLKFGDNAMPSDEMAVMTPDGDRLLAAPLAMAGDRGRRLYLAYSDRIYAVDTM